MMINDPNGYPWPLDPTPVDETAEQHYIRTCTGDAGNSKDWPMPKPPPYPADDEATT